MAGKQAKPSEEQQQYKAIKQEYQSHLMATVVPALMSREDVASVVVPQELNMKAPNGGLIVVLQNGTNIKARFVVDEIFAVE